MDDKVVKIPLSVFQNRYSISVPPSITQKAEALKKSCSCFESYYDPKMIWEKKLYYKKERSQHNAHTASHTASHTSSHTSYNASHTASHTSYNASHTASQASHTKGRVHIIIPDFSDNSNTKRALIGQLNKLTTKNKDIICEKIKNIIADNSTEEPSRRGEPCRRDEPCRREELFLIILSYIKVYDGDNNLYIGLLEYFDSDFLKNMIDKLWDSYLNNKEWVPPKYIFENNLLLLNNEYELYCDYIKWKKGIHNINVLWIKYKKAEISSLLNNIYTYLTEECIGNPTIHKYILDIFLEQLLKILNKHPDKSIVEKIKALDIKGFDSSTKFLIYNIIENK